jgi:hypothetical protein
MRIHLMEAGAIIQGDWMPKGTKGTNREAVFAMVIEGLAETIAALNPKLTTADIAAMILKLNEKIISERDEQKGSEE